MPTYCPIPATLPGEPAVLEALVPLVAHLAANTPVGAVQQFPRGTIQPDGRLDLCKQALGAAGCALVTAALADNTQVRSLMLGTDGIGDAGATSVAELIGHNQRIETLYLGCNQIGEPGMQTLATALIEAPHVRHLWLKRNPLGGAGLMAIVALLEQTNSLITLDLVNTLPDAVALGALLETLTHRNRSVQRLYLGGNDIGADAPFGALLAANPALTALLLNVNALGDGGAQALAAGLRQNTTLRELGLASNGLGRAGVVALADAVAAHPALERLDLGYAASTQVLGAQANQIGDDGAQALAEALRSHPALLSIDLRRGGVGPAGVAALRTALRDTYRLQRLHLDGSPDAEIAALLERNRALSGPLVAPADVQAIRSVYR